MGLRLSAGMPTCCVLGLLVVLGCNASDPGQPVASHPAEARQAAEPHSQTSEAPTVEAQGFEAEGHAHSTEAASTEPSTERLATQPSGMSETALSETPATADEVAAAESPAAHAAGEPSLEPSAEEGSAEHNPATDTSTADAAAASRAATAEPSTENDVAELAASARAQHDDASAPPADESNTNAKRRPKLDWPQPKVVFVFSGRQHGYIEPCGCQTLAEQKGGLSRRHTLIRELSEKGWTVVPLDVGDQVRRFGRQAEIKFQFTIEGLKEMQYRAVGFGPDDLQLSIDELAAATAQISQQQTPFVSANIAVLDRELTPRFQVVEANGMRIGITSVLGDEAIAKLNVDEVLTEPALAALKTSWQQLEAEQCDYHVLLAYATREETEKLAQAVPHFDLVVTSDGGEIPASQLTRIPPGKSHLVEIGPKGMYVSVVGVFDDRTNPLRHELVPLNASFEDSREMLDLMASYQEQLKRLGLEGLGIRPLNHPSGRKFVGSEKCGECHTKAFAIWQETPHHHATKSLTDPTERSEIPRHFDPECLSCHVTGWNPQRFVPYESGYLSLEKTPEMVGNGCENCHGPGSAHVAAESGDLDVGEAELHRLRSEMVLKLSEAESRCVECHDLDNSPTFHFNEYWEQVAHEGKD